MERKSFEEIAKQILHDWERNDWGKYIPPEITEQEKDALVTRVTQALQDAARVEMPSAKESDKAMHEGSTQYMDGWHDCYQWLRKHIEEARK